MFGARHDRLGEQGNQNIANPWVFILLFNSCTKRISIVQGVPKKPHFQNHHPGPTIHPSPQAWLAGSKQPRWRVSLQDNDSESAFFWDTLYACLLVFECFRVFIPKQVHILRILSLKSSFWGLSYLRIFKTNIFQDRLWFLDGRWI